MLCRPRCEASKIDFGMDIATNQTIMTSARPRRRDSLSSTSSKKQNDNVTAIVQLAIGLTEFKNVDLFEKGHYVVKCFLDPIKNATMYNVKLNVPSESYTDGSAECVGSGTLLKGKIGLRSPVVTVSYSDDHFDYRTGITLEMHVRVPTNECALNLGKIIGDLHAELWFHATDSKAMKKVSTVHQKIHRLAYPGVRYGGWFEFDFFHTAAIGITVNSVLVGFEPATDTPSTLPPSAHTTRHATPHATTHATPHATAGNTQHSENNSLFNPAITRETSNLHTNAGSLWIDQLLLLNTLITGSLKDSKQRSTTLGIQTHVAALDQATKVLSASLSSTLERLSLITDPCKGLAEYNKFVQHCSALLSKTWKPMVEQLTFSKDIFDKFAYESRIDKLHQLQHGYFVADKPLVSFFASNHKERGRRLAQLAMLLRLSLFYRLLSPTALENVTEPIRPGSGPIIAEYRSFSQSRVFPTRKAIVKPKCKPCFPHTHSDLEQAKTLLRAQTGSLVPLSETHTLLHPAYVEDTSTGRGHVVFCVHGMSGNQYDLRLVKLQLLDALPGLTFVMSAANQDKTHKSFEEMRDAFVIELEQALDKHRPSRVSFIGHSLGNIIIRSALSLRRVQLRFSLPDDAAAAGTKTKTTPTKTNTTDTEAKRTQTPSHRTGIVKHRGRSNLRPILQTFVTLAAPHVGALYLNGVVSTGMWFLSRWKRSASLNELTLCDTQDPRESFMYRLSKTNSLCLFQNVILQASPQDKYANMSSSMIHSCPQAASDTRFGEVYEEMVKNLSQPLQDCERINLVRLYVMVAPGPRTIASVIGRAAHIACLDDEHVAKKIGAGICRYFE
eukprot:m.166000 g.166000  ORF g.166000 m.166000 type:complete len:840 (+) comp31409_c0_seq1:240-2759(+)